MAAREARIGPWLVAIGAALWGTESAWRIPLNGVFSEDVLVFWEHAILVVLALPFVVPRLRELKTVRRATIAWLLLSGVAGSAVGTVLFTAALKYGNATVVNVVLNIQPVISTTAACLLLGDRLSRGFYPAAAVAVIAGIFLVNLAPGLGGAVDLGTGFALGCALFWGLSTVVGRAVMNDMSLGLASGLRVVIGLVSMTAIVLASGHMNATDLWPAAASEQSWTVIRWLIGLATLSGGIPLVIYFQGLHLTKASTAGYFEMMQTLAATAITWGIMGESLAWYQALAGGVLIIAVVFVQRAQETAPVTPN